MRPKPDGTRARGSGAGPADGVAGGATLRRTAEDGSAFGGERAGNTVAPVTASGPATRCPRHPLGPGRLRTGSRSGATRDAGVRCARGPRAPGDALDSEGARRADRGHAEAYRPAARECPAEGSPAGCRETRFEAREAVVSHDTLRGSGMDGARGGARRAVDGAGGRSRVAIAARVAGSESGTEDAARARLRRCRRRKPSMRIACRRYRPAPLPAASTACRQCSPARDRARTGDRTCAKVGAALAATAAVVAEFVASNRGLGYLLLEYNGNLETAMVFAVVILLSAMGLALYGFVEFLERLAIPWHARQRGAGEPLPGA